MKLIIDIDKEEYDILMLWKDHPIGHSWAERQIIAGIPLDNLREEIEKEVWNDVVVSLDGTDETRIPRLDLDDVLRIIDKYKNEVNE